MARWQEAVAFICSHALVASFMPAAVALGPKSMEWKLIAWPQRACRLGAQWEDGAQVLLGWRGARGSVGLPGPSPASLGRWCQPWAPWDEAEPVRLGQVGRKYSRPRRADVHVCREV